MKRLAFLFSLAALSCAMSPPKSQYDFALADARPAGQIKPLTYSDNALEATFELERTGIGAVIGNRTESTMKILWDEASLVDIDGMSHNVMSSELSPDDPSQLVPATVVVAGSKHAAFIVPSENADYHDGYWHYESLLPYVDQSGTAKAVKKQRAEFGTRQIKLLLPIESAGVKTEYLFTFDVAIAELK
jgi:hypothetical protein